MGYREIGNANAFTGGLMQGLGLYNDIRRTRLLDEDIKYQRERQREQDRIDARKTEAYLRNLDQEHELAKQEHERRQFMLRAGDLADKLRGISGITDGNVRQEALDNLALSINEDPFLVEYLNLNPQIGSGQGRKVVGFHVLNPDEKNPVKYKYAPIVFNEALRSVGPYTADNTARWPQQAGISFDIEALDRIAGRTPAERKVVSAVPEGGRHPVHMYEDEAIGLMPGADWRYSLGQRAATERAAMRGTGKEKDPWVEYQNRAAKFFQTHKGIKTGEFYDMKTALEMQDVAKRNGIHLVFNKAVDPETGEEGVRLVDHRALDEQVEVVSPRAMPGTQVVGQPAPSQKVKAPSAPGYYTEIRNGQAIEKEWDGKQFVRVKVNGQWVPVSTAAAHATAVPEAPPGGLVPGGVTRLSDVRITGAPAQLPATARPVNGQLLLGEQVEVLNPGRTTVRASSSSRSVQGGGVAKPTKKPRKGKPKEKGIEPSGLLGKWLRGDIETPELPKGGILRRAAEKGKPQDPRVRAKDAIERAYNPAAKVTVDDAVLLEEVARPIVNEQVKREILQAAKRIRKRLS